MKNKIVNIALFCEYGNASNMELPVIIRGQVCPKENLLDQVRCFVAQAMCYMSDSPAVRVCGVEGFEDPEIEDVKKQKNLEIRDFRFANSDWDGWIDIEGFRILSREVWESFSVASDMGFNYQILSYDEYWYEKFEDDDPYPLEICHLISDLLIKNFENLINKS